MPSIHHQAWGLTPAGPARLFTLTNDRGNSVRISDYGATLTSVLVNDHQWVAGYDDLRGYLGDQPYFGATVGRYANRIAGGRFTLNGREYAVPINNGPNCLHGGREGFDKRVWRVEGIDATGRSLTLRHTDPSGWQGFPGEVSVTVRYVWTEADELRIEYHATTDAPTVINLTNHAYFTPGDGPTVGDLELTLHADRYLPVDDTSIPLGEPATVAGTPFDFRHPRPVRQGFGADHPQTERAGGYDHNLIVSDWNGELREIAVVRDPATGRTLRCATTQPGVQLFTANFETGQFSARDGGDFPRHGAICLETQHFPDSPNRPDFPSTVLEPGSAFRAQTVYRFA